MERQKLYDLKNQHKQAVEAAESAYTAKDMETYQAKMEDIKRINDDIAACEAILAEEGRYDDHEEKFVTLGAAAANRKADEAHMTAVNAARSGNEYANAWAKAIRNKVAPDMGLSDEGLKPLYNALTVGGGDPAGADGGFLVPVDFDNMIHTLAKEYLDLAQFFGAETVSAPTGWRAIETSAMRRPLPVVDEMGEIGKDEQPKFRKVTYTLKKYGDRLVVSSELLKDNTAGLMQYLAGWWGPKLILTRNNLCLGMMDALPSTALTAGKEVRELKTALNKSLNTAYSRGAIILTNQDGYDQMDGWEDKQGRPMLVPNPADPDVYRFKGRRVIYADNDFLPNAANDASAPLYIGSFKAVGTLFSKEATEIASTNVGGSAWATDSTEIRCIARMCNTAMDTAAAIKRTMALTAGV